ncbi:hypothetical protein B0H14DRAFT_3589341 [Mycena olivaceomarginata]|nr:hypothetical protein B0H14DRAFT_3589341 [Mycena olivaceomarginata]
MRGIRVDHPPIKVPPSTPTPVSSSTAFTTPLSPLTPLPETPRPFQERQELIESLPSSSSTIAGWLSPPPAGTNAPGTGAGEPPAVTGPRETTDADKNGKRLGRPQQSLYRVSSSNSLNSFNVSVMGQAAKSGMAPHFVPSEASDAGARSVKRRSVTSDRETRSTSLRKAAGGGGRTFGRNKSFFVAVTPLKQMNTEASPSKTPSFANPTKSSAAKVVRPRLVSTAAGSSGSPSTTTGKHAKSLFPARPPPSFARTFTRPGETSALQTLASALEKLRIPPPERPNTSMGFSRDHSNSNFEESSLTRSADARNVGMRRPSGRLQIAVTVGDASSSIPIAEDFPSMSKAPPPAKSARLLSMPMAHGKAAGGQFVREDGSESEPESRLT